MSPEHPLHEDVHAVADPKPALAELGVDQVVADLHQHHHQTPVVEKVIDESECRPGGVEDQPTETIHAGHWNLVGDEKGLGDLFGPHIGEGDPEPVDVYPDPAEEHHPLGDHALDDGGVDHDMGAVTWGSAVE